MVTDSTVNACRNFLGIKNVYFKTHTHTHTHTEKSANRSTILVDSKIINKKEGA